MTPIDPTPLIWTYAGLAFGAWLIPATYTVRILVGAAKKGVFFYNSGNPEIQKQMRAVVENDPELRRLNTKVRASLPLVLLCWLLGGLLLGGTLFILDQCDLLIDHRRGIYEAR